MKRGGPAHIKTKRLAKALGIQRFAAVGIAESLFHLAAAQAQAGDIGRLSDDEIAAEIGWEQPAGQLISALIEVGWLDACSCHRLRIHDWNEHADQTVERVLSKQKRGFLSCYDDASTVLASSYDRASTKLASSPMPSPSPSPEPPARKRSRRSASEPPESWPEEWRAPLMRRLWQTRPWLLQPDPPKPHCTRSWVYAEAEACLDWHRQKGRSSADWVASVSNWIAKDDGREWTDGLPRVSPFHDLARSNPEKYLPRELREEAAA